MQVDHFGKRSGELPAYSIHNILTALVAPAGRVHGVQYNLPRVVKADPIIGKNGVWFDRCGGIIKNKGAYTITVQLADHPIKLLPGCTRGFYPIVRIRLLENIGCRCLFIKSKRRRFYQ